MRIAETLDVSSAQIEVGSERLLARVAHTMRLEGQEISSEALADLRALLSREVSVGSPALSQDIAIFDGDASPSLDPDEATGLIPPLERKQQLNDFEALNIARGLHEAMRCPSLHRDLLTVSGLLSLHRHMFGETWSWAGSMRRRDTNIGVPSEQVATALGSLCGDVAYQVAQRTLPWDELAARFHHRLVSIHPFPNGNGRHARLTADLLLHVHGQPMFAWGEGNGLGMAETRRLYLAALRVADGGDISALLRFARS